VYVAVLFLTASLLFCGLQADWPPLFAASLRGDTASIDMLSNQPSFNVNQTAEVLLVGAGTVVCYPSLVCVCVGVLQFGWTALMWAVDACQADATSMLIRLGADVNAVSRV
jgi:hypothetical protein